MIWYIDYGDKASGIKKSAHNNYMGYKEKSRAMSHIPSSYSRSHASFAVASQIMPKPLDQTFDIKKKRDRFNEQYDDTISQ